MIEVKHDPEMQLTTFTCTGTPTPEEVEAQLVDFYKDTPSLFTIWDYTSSDLSELTAGKIRELAGVLKKTSHSREGGRSALVFSMAQLMVINDRLPSLAELEIEKASIKIFSEMEKALAWIAG